MTAITLNGTGHEVPGGSTVATVVAWLTPTADGCAVAVNDEVVPRHDWASRTLSAGDRVEVLTAVQGG
ncbi:MAG TPA: sulfur carrier protein ThiS [Mycobacteriales bacterium]|jgi:sulfur carrier protein|nr:sulfur carrier protein ThiS [Mycobacteriales bacterium]HVX69035.1 sulfur carrier protein ThiS [Mycobacteriales bacterium]